MQGMPDSVFMGLSGTATILWASIALWEQSVSATLVAATIAVACAIVGGFALYDYMENTNSQLDNRVPNDQ